MRPEDPLTTASEFRDKILDIIMNKPNFLKAFGVKTLGLNFFESFDIITVVGLLETLSIMSVCIP